MKTSRILLNISTVICFIFGALYVFSLVFIPIGIYCFIAAKRFREKADHLYDNMAMNNDVFKNYVIFVSIACFPLGLISIIPYFMIISNNIKVSTTVEEDNGIKISSVVDNEEIKEEKTEEVEVHIEETEEEKIAKFNKLKNFHEKGIITDEELEMAREQLFGKEEK